MWGGKVVITHCQQHPHKWILGQGAAQCFTGIGKLALIPLPALIDREAENLVQPVRFITKFGAHILVEHRCVRWSYRREGWIELWRFGHIQLAQPPKARIEPPG